MHTMESRGFQLFVFLVVIFVFQGCEARTWVNLVDPTVFSLASIDPYKIEFSIESDPFAFGIPPPSPVPVEDVFIETDVDRGDDTGSDYAAETEAPSLAPIASTEAPTQRDENIAGNGGCEFGQYLYRVRMHDRWGDGWDQTSLKILEIPSHDEQNEFEKDIESPLIISEEDNKVIMSSTVEVNHQRPLEYDQLPIWEEKLVFKGSLEEGLNGYSYVCLQQNTCYDVIVDGGQWEDEVKWDIQSAPVLAADEDREAKEAVTVAKGWAPAHCQFSIANDESEELVCPLACKLDSQKATMDPEVSAAPSDAPSLVPSTLSSRPPSDAPSLMPSDAPSNTPSLAVWGIDY